MSEEKKDPTTEQWLKAADAEDELELARAEIRRMHKACVFFAFLLVASFAAIVVLNLLDKPFWPFFLFSVGSVAGMAITSPEASDHKKLRELELKHRQAQRRLGT